MLYAAGLRVRTAGLPLASVRGKEKFVLVTGKGGKERLAPSIRARARSNPYLEVLDDSCRENSPRATRFLFVRGTAGFSHRQRLHQC